MLRARSVHLPYKELTYSPGEGDNRNHEENHSTEEGEAVHVADLQDREHRGVFCEGGRGRGEGKEEHCDIKLE